LKKEIAMSLSSLAVDIGASSGRLLAGYISEGKLITEEIHRFENRLLKKDDHFCWDVDHLFKEIKAGIKQSKAKGLQASSIGIDTWAVDFVLLDEYDHLLTGAVAYRDPRTDGMMEEVFEIIPKEILYAETGIQFQKFNTIYQLYYLKKNDPDILKKAKTFLMVPDYLNFLLTGVKANEYTNATSTQLVNVFTQKWDVNLLEKLGINSEIFENIYMPKTRLGPLRKSLVHELGLDMDVILPATHDTGSAVVAVPETKETIYISSGTWSLMGIENSKPLIGEQALNYNFTNEGGVDSRFRFLKNIMGLWMIQEVKRQYDDNYSYADFVKMAKETYEFSSIVNVDDQRFLKPENMIEEIQQYCLETDQPVPKTVGEIGKCVFDSLVKSYQSTVKQIEELREMTFDQINVIGGGSQNDMINQLIADATGKMVYAGPVEATAIGNIVTQLISQREIKDVHEARVMIKNSFEIKLFKGSD